LVDRHGIPLAACLPAANTHDSMLLEMVVDAVAPVKGRRGRPGRPRKRPAKLHLDKAYDYPALVLILCGHGMRPGAQPARALLSGLLIASLPT
jgi:hypothetical protein